MIKILALLRAARNLSRALTSRFALPRVKMCERSRISRNSNLFVDIY